MRLFASLFVVLVAVTGAAASARATAPGSNGHLVFRRYLDVAKTTAALFTARPDGSGERQVTRPRRNVVDTEPDWSPNGRKLAFVRQTYCPAGGARNGLDNTCDLVYSATRSGAELRPLVACGFQARGRFPANCVGVHTPAWSPDGSKLAVRLSLVDPRYVRSLRLNAGIWIVSADGSRLRQITQRTPGSSEDFGPQWSPGGKKLAFVRYDFKTRNEAVFTVNVDGTGLFQVTPFELHAGDGPDWSPDGQWLLFSGHPKDRSSNVYKVRPDGSDLTNLTRQPRDGYQYLSSSFSPDGTMITTSRTPGTGPERAADVVVMDADGSNIRPVTKTRLWDSATDWGAAPATGKE